MRVCAVGGSWALESAGACGTAAAIPWAAANGDGPGGGEYYWRDEGAEDDSISAGVATCPITVMLPSPAWICTVAAAFTA
ncbi:MAG: hypothetical protein R3A10_18105 [Caldilineaceae bacterium]